MTWKDILDLTNKEHGSNVLSKIKIFILIEKRASVGSFFVQERQVFLRCSEIL
jgi:hypothetical protein